MLDNEELDLTVNPPADLAIEVDIGPPDVARQPIYAALGVPEVWRYDRQHVHVLQRRADGTYAAVDRSRWLPDPPPARLNEFIEIGLKQGQTAAVRAMLGWIAARG